MSEPKDMSNEELYALLATRAEIAADISGNMEFAAELAEAARRLAALPRIYDVSKGERPGDGSIVLAINGRYVRHLKYSAKRDALLDSVYSSDGAEAVVGVASVTGFQFMVDVNDIAAWVKGVKG